MRGLLPYVVWLRQRPAFVLIVLLPVVVSGLYLGLFATDRYRSESKLVVKKAGIASDITQTGFAALLTGITSQTEDVYFLKEYLQSPDVLALLDKKLELRKLYSDSKIDILHRLAPDATKEEFLAHFQSMTTVTLDETTGILTLSSQAFRPIDAQKINRQMTVLAEEYINGLSHRAAQEQTAYVEKEIISAKAKLDLAIENMMDFQNKHNLLNPIQAAQSATAVTTELEANITKLDADLKNMLAYMNPEAPQVVALKHRISALRAQLAQEKTKITGAPQTKTGVVLNELAGEYALLDYQLKFATKVYEATMTSMEQLRVEIAQKLKTVVMITEPQVPEESAFPQFTKTLLTILVVCLLVYFAFRLIVATIEDHRD